MADKQFTRSALRMASLVHHEGWEELRKEVDQQREAAKKQLADALFAGGEVDRVKIAELRGIFLGMEKILAIPEFADKKIQQEEEKNED